MHIIDVENRDGIDVAAELVHQYFPKNFTTSID
jgi:hypothetical protein